MKCPKCLLDWLIFYQSWPMDQCFCVQRLLYLTCDGIQAWLNCTDWSIDLTWLGVVGKSVSHTVWIFSTFSSIAWLIFSHNGLFFGVATEKRKNSWTVLAIPNVCICHRNSLFSSVTFKIIPYFVSLLGCFFLSSQILCNSISINTMAVFIVSS